MQEPEPKNGSSTWGKCEICFMEKGKVDWWGYFFEKKWGFVKVTN